MSDEPTSKRCDACEAEIPSPIELCPQCGASQPKAGPPASTGFTFEDDDESAVDTPSAPDVPAETQPISAEDVPAEDVPAEDFEAMPEVAGTTMRMSVGDMGKAWLEETMEGAGAVAGDATAASGDAPASAGTESKRKGCLPLLAALVILPAAVLVMLLF